MNNKVRKRILIVTLIVISLVVAWIYTPRYSGEKISYIKIDTNGVPRWHGFSMANSNTQTIVFTLLRMGNYKAAVTFESERKTTNQAAIITMNATLKNAGLRSKTLYR